MTKDEFGDSLGQDEIVDGYLLQKGTPLWILLSNSSFDDTLFSNSSNFNPQRWIEMSRADKKETDSKLAPFGGGKRICPGKLLSFIEMKVVLIELFKRYKIERAPNSPPVEDNYGFTLMPDNLNVILKKRSLN